MSTRILSGARINEDQRPGAVLYDSTDGVAFGPVFDSEHDADAFLSYIGYIDDGTSTQVWVDPYKCAPADLQKYYIQWIRSGKERINMHGRLTVAVDE